MGYKPSVFKQAKFDYSPLGNIFTKGLDKDDQKEGLFKYLDNVKDKNEKLLNTFSEANRVSKAAKNESDFNYDSNYAFYDFYRGFKNFKKSLGSKYDEINDFYMILSNFNNHKPTTNKTNNRTDRILNNVNQLYNDYFALYKKNYKSTNVKNEEKRGRDYKQFETIDTGNQGAKSTKKEETETKKTIMEKIK